MEFRSKLILLAALATNVPLLTAQTPVERLAKWKRVDMPFHSAGLSARERQMVEKLVEACRLLDEVYWRQSDIDGLALYKTPKTDTRKMLLSIMGSRWDLLDENKPFAGAHADASGPRAVSARSHAHRDRSIP